MSTDIIGYLYASTVAAGGIMGYVKAGTQNILTFSKIVINLIIVLASIPSLAAGLAFGAILGKFAEPYTYIRLINLLRSRIRSPFELTRTTKAVGTIGRITGASRRDGVALAEIRQTNAGRYDLRNFLCSFHSWIVHVSAPVAVLGWSSLVY